MNKIFLLLQSLRSISMSESKLEELLEKFQRLKGPDPQVEQSKRELNQINMT